MKTGLICAVASSLPCCGYPLLAPHLAGGGSENLQMAIRPVLPHRHAVKAVSKCGCRLLACALLCLFVATASAQVRPMWTNRYDNATPGRTNTPLGIALDPAGSLLIAGSSVNTSNDWDYLVLKYAANGTALWTNRYDSGSNDQAGASWWTGRGTRWSPAHRRR